MLNKRELFIDAIHGIPLKPEQYESLKRQDLGQFVSSTLKGDENWAWNLRKLYNLSLIQLERIYQRIRDGAEVRYATREDAA